MSSAAVSPASSGSPHGLAQALADTQAALDVLAGQPLWAVTNPGVLDTLGELTAAAARLDAVRLAVIAQVETRGAAIEAGAPSTTAWLRGALRLAPGAAASQTRLALRLTDPGLQATAQALADGTISAAHATVIARTLDSLPADLDETTCA